MFSESRLQTIILTSQIESAKSFYRDVLGLELKGGSDGALVFDVGGADLRVSPVPSTGKTEHTVAGFSVPNVDRAIEFLGARGISLERFPGFPHDRSGVLVTPEGSRVAWFRDPDGNLLSVVQFAAA